MSSNWFYDAAPVTPRTWKNDRCLMGYSYGNLTMTEILKELLAHPEFQRKTNMMLDQELLNEPRLPETLSEVSFDLEDYSPCDLYVKDNRVFLYMMDELHKYSFNDEFSIKCVFKLSDAGISEVESVSCFARSTHEYFSNHQNAEYDLLLQEQVVFLTSVL